jgi:hypothetical protein
MARQGRSCDCRYALLAAKRFHAARSTAAPRWALRRTLRNRRRFDLGVEDFGDDGLGCRDKKLALLLAGKIPPFEPGLVGSQRLEAFGRLEGLDLLLQGPVHGDIVFREQMQSVLGRKLLRRLLRQNHLPIEQHDPSLEVLLGFERGVSCRIERLDERDLLDEYESFTDGDDFHIDLLCVG